MRQSASGESVSDVCSAVPRAAIVQTCAAALAVGDLMTARYGTAWMERPTSYRREGL